MNLPAPFDLLALRDRQPVEVAQSGTLFRQGERTRGMFVLLRGAVTLRRQTASGHPVVIHTARAGQTFAEASLFSETYHCDAVATVAVRALCLARGAVLDLMQRDADFALSLGARFARDLQEARRRYEVLSIKAAEDRVFAALLAFGQEGTATDFADSIGLSPEATYRALSALTGAGRIVRTGRGRYTVPDAP